MEIELHRKQYVAFSSVATEVLYGGAAGGGKSHLMRIEATVFCIMIPGFNAYLFRRKSEDLKKNHLYGAGGFYVLLSKQIENKQCKINEQKGEITFSNGSKIFLCHCQHEKDKYNYQGAEIHGLFIDELTHFTETIYTFLRGRCRIGSLRVPKNALEMFGSFPKILCGSNPGNIGHNWVKRTFVDYQPFLEMIKTDKTDGGMTRQYIPALLKDNPTLLENDPDYEMRLEGLGSRELVEAMKNGNWDITSGGAIDDVWQRDTHVLETFKIPSSWKIDRGYDWGSAKPAASLWFAESNGEEVELNDGTIKIFPRGTVFIIKELYFWSGKENVGSRLTASEHAAQIKDIDKHYESIGNHVYAGGADNAIWTADNGKSIADDMAEVGVNWEKSNKAPGTRLQGLQKIREMLKDAINSPKEKPGLYVFSSCSHTIRTVPTLPRDERKPEDIDTNAEDHIYDVIRYRLIKQTYAKISGGFKK